MVVCCGATPFRGPCEVPPGRCVARYVAIGPGRSAALAALDTLDAEGELDAHSKLTATATAVVVGGGDVPGGGTAAQQACVEEVRRVVQGLWERA